MKETDFPSGEEPYGGGGSCVGSSPRGICQYGRPRASECRNLTQLSSQHLQFSSAQSLSRVQLFVTPWTAARQASPSITSSQSLLKLMSIESVMPSNHLILCCPLLLPSIFPSIRVFSNESVLCIGWPKYWSFIFSISPSMNIQD